jgi:hypothetical protein
MYKFVDDIKYLDGHQFLLTLVDYETCDNDVKNYSNNSVLGSKDDTFPTHDQFC